MDETTSTGRAGQVGVHLSIPIYGLQYRLISLVRVGGMLMNLKHIFRTRAWEMASCKGPFWPWLSFRQNTKTDEQKKTPATTKNSFVPGMPRPLDVHGRWEYPEAMNFPAPKQCANDFKKSEMRKLQRATLSFFSLSLRQGRKATWNTTHAS